MFVLQRSIECHCDPDVMMYHYDQIAMEGLMGVYASTPGYAERGVRPSALALILVGHVAVIAAAMTMKMVVAPRLVDPPLVITPLPVDPVPEPRTEPRKPPVNSGIDQVDPIVPTPAPQPLPIDPAPRPAPADPLAGTSPTPLPLPLPVPDPVRVGPRFTTPPSMVEPPYPLAKREADEEAALRLRLTIDARGRVVAVEPVGRADPVFLQAARKHILAKWRYAPASEDGRAIASSTVVTLRFQLER